MDNAIEVIKAIGYLIIYPVGIAWISIQTGGKDSSQFWNAFTLNLEKPCLIE